MIEALFEKLHGALSENTLRAYRSDYTHFTTWCQEHEVEPLAHEPTAMMNYLTHMASQSSVATIVRRLASLSSLFKYWTSQTSLDSLLPQKVRFLEFSR